LGVPAFPFPVSFSLWFDVEQKRTQRFGLQLKQVIALHPPGFNQVIVGSLLYFSLLSILHIVQILSSPKNPFFLFFYFALFLFNL